MPLEAGEVLIGGRSRRETATARRNGTEANPHAGAGTAVVLGFGLWQVLVGAFAGFLIGVSKTGVPGIGILVVPLLAEAFGGRASVGTMLPMLIVGDIFAVLWYRHHARWNRLIELIPWVSVGMALGAFLLWRLGEAGIG